MAGEKNPEKIVADANVILSKNEKQELREFASKSPEKVKQEAIVSLETVYKIKEIIASRGKATLNREQIAVMQLYVNLK
jgi:ribosomal 30S subunit maturation factor RimM